MARKLVAEFPEAMTAEPEALAPMPARQPR
ncbi:hypothetical protein SAMN04487779_1012109 [Belnapia rosea]|uniref:Uncharacterized protein n=1 Tax=Belnapia rosea TaxID=938405 RepID=A0A1G6XP41_9PROT|nr:hypothetical protein SAMN04487779_1012109 [Belnapia rosea]